MKPVYMVMVLKPSSKAGSGGYLAYLCSANPKPEENAWGVGDRVKSIAWNMDVPFDRDRPRDMARLFDAECRSHRAQVRYRSVIFSCQATDNPEEHAQGLALAGPELPAPVDQLLFAEEGAPRRGSASRTGNMSPSP